MELNEININDCRELSEINDMNIDEKIFEDLITLVKNTFKRLSINTNDMYMYYQRFANQTSVLALKVTSGSNDDIENYMINGCDARWNRSNDISCDVYLHAKAKSAKKSTEIAGLISKDIVNFFNKIETELNKNNLKNIELSVFLPLFEKKDTEEKSQEVKESKIKRLIRKFKNK